MSPVHWFQFANDAAVITTQESENQHLLNRFSVWCQWSNMFIRVEKCTFMARWTGQKYLFQNTRLV